MLTHVDVYGNLIFLAKMRLKSISKYLTQQINFSTTQYFSRLLFLKITYLLEKYELFSV